MSSDANQHPRVRVANAACGAAWYVAVSTVCAEAWSTGVVNNQVDP